MRFIDLERTLKGGMAKKNFEELTKYLGKAEDMANSEDASLHGKYAFEGLMSRIKAHVAVCDLNFPFFWQGKEEYI